MPMTPARLLAAAALTAAVGACGTPNDPRLPIAPTRSPERRDLRAAEHPRTSAGARQTSGTATGPALQPAWTPERARASALVALQAFCRTAPPDPRCSGTRVDQRVAFAPSTNK